MRNFNHLYYFHVVSKLGSVTAAARELNTSQSSLSMQLKTLEGQMGKPLFERSGRNLLLTPLGHQVSHYCRRMFDIAGELDGFLHRREHQGKSTFAVGVSPDIERPFVTDILAHAISSGVRKNGQRPVVTLASHPHEKLIAKLELGELDAVLSSQPIHSNTARTQLEAKLPVKAIARAQKGKLIRHLLRDDDVGLVLPTVEMRIRWEIDGFLTKKRIRKNVAFESNVMGAIVRACIDGLGIGFLPEAYVIGEIRRGTLMASRESLWNHRLYLSSRKTSSSEEAKSMVQALSSQLEQFVRV
ncbi:MAG: LysR family transcriptional regulator [Bdellovibrionales bacterium]|nr:LysR family transcriptional regulator [Bdellovibrionales bacterium]